MSHLSTIIQGTYIALHKVILLLAVEVKNCGQSAEQMLFSTDLIGYGQRDHERNIGRDCGVPVPLYNISRNSYERSRREDGHGALGNRPNRNSDELW